MEQSRMIHRLLLLVGVLHIDEILCSDCACSTTAVHVRSGAGTTHTLLTTLQPGWCLPFKGHRQTVGTDTWVNVDYQGKDGWIHEGYVHIRSCDGASIQGGSSGSSGGTSTHTGTSSHSGTSTGSNHVQLPGCPRIITREEWGALHPTHPLQPLSHTPHYMFIHHGASPSCHTEQVCKQMVKNVQTYYINTRGYSDTGYSFLVGEDGNAYEARGWDNVGAHTLNYNHDGLAICVIGDFTDRLPNEAALNTVKQLIACGLANGKLTPDYKLRGHRDVGATACPGNKLYELIRHWPHY